MPITCYSYKGAIKNNKKNLWFIILCVPFIFFTFICHTILFAYQKHNDTKQYIHSLDTILLPKQKENRNNNATLKEKKSNNKVLLNAVQEKGSSVWSNAFNFQKSWGTQVDPRTGILSAYIKAGSLISNLNRGPNIDLGANYSSNSFANPDEIGVGWSWNLTHFNPINNQLSTSQGQAFNLERISKGYWRPRYHKLRDIQIDGDKQTHFIITYANGLREILNHNGYEIRLEQQDGRGVNFNYEPGSHLLSVVSDDQGYKIRLSYHDDYITVTSYDSNGKPVNIRLSYLNSELRSVTFQNGKGNFEQGVYLKYHHLHLLNGITYPTGLQKRISYDCNNEMKLTSQNSSQPRALCVVTQEMVQPGFAQPDRVVNYSYGQSNRREHNYLAFNAGLDGLTKSSQDILFEAPVSYTYQTIQDNGVVKQIRTYNKYHLLIDAQMVSDHTGHVLSAVHNYFCRTDKEDGCSHNSFENLPVTYSLPLKIVTSDWGDSSDSPSVETVIKAYNDAGKVTSTTDAYGRVEKISYCPVQGDASCPEEPESWSVSTKVEAVTRYPSATVSGSSALSPVTIRNYYRKEPNLNGHGYILVLAKEVVQSGGRNITTTRKYNSNTNNHFTYGLLQQQTVTGTTEQDDDIKSVTKNYYYLLSADHATKTTYVATITNNGQSVRSPSETSSLFTNQVIERRDSEDKNITQYHYDSLGRLTTVDHAIGTPFAVHEHYQYTVSNALNQVISTSANGLQQKAIFDGAGEKLATFREAISSTGKVEPGKWLPVQSINYDNFGRITNHHTYRFSDTEQLTDLITTTEYNDMGKVFRSHLPDGEIIFKQYYDPGRCLVSYTQNRKGEHSAISIVYANMLDKPEKQILLPASTALMSTRTLCLTGDQLTGAKTTKDIYDGFGRVVSSTDPMGWIVTKRYNSESQMTDIINPVGDITHYVYNLTGQVIATWALPAKDSHKYLLSSAGYNAAGKLMWKAGEDGKRTSYTYTPGGRIATKTTPAGHVMSWKYNVLGLPVSVFLDGKVLSQIDYDSVTALPVRKEDITGITTYAYTDDNKIQRLTHTGENEYPNYRVEWQYNKNRQIISFIDICGNITDTIYDNLGRVKSAYYYDFDENKRLLSSVLYDDFSRIISANYGSGMQRTLLYNGYGQQGSVTDTLAGKLLSKWQYNYDADGNITTIIQSADQGKQAVLHYQYDGRDNMTTMTCSGSPGLPLCPRDTAFQGSGLKQAPVITRQYYRFNTLNRMMQTEETLTDSLQKQTLSKITTYGYSDMRAPLRLQRVTTSWNGKYETHPFIYDASGNMTIDGKGNRLSYNAFNQIIQVESSEGKNSYYDYDGSGLEVKIITAQKETSHLFYANKSLLGEQISGINHEVNTVGYLPGAKTINGIISEYYEKNYKGDVTAILTKTTNDSYTLNQYNVYSPYGMVWHNVLKPPLPLYQQTLLGFDGERTDTDTGWQFLGNGHRTYNPVGRYFVSEDPSGDGYAFGSNNPIMNTDPSGNMSKWMGKALHGLNYVTTLGFAAIHKTWANVTGTVLMVGLSTIAGAVMAAYFGASPKLIAGISAVSIAAGSVSVAAAAMPANKGLNIANAIVGSTLTTISLAAWGTGILVVSLRAFRIIFENIFAAADSFSDISSIYSNNDLDAYFSSGDLSDGDRAFQINNEADLQRVWGFYRNRASNINYTNIPLLLVAALESQQKIKAVDLEFLIELENDIINKQALAVRSYKRYFYLLLSDYVKQLPAHCDCYSEGVDITKVIQPGEGKIVKLYPGTGSNDSFLGYLFRYRNSEYGAACWGLYNFKENGNVEYISGNYAQVGLAKFIGSNYRINVMFVLEIRRP